MSTDSLVIDGRDIPLDQDACLCNLADWSPPVAEALAAQGIEIDKKVITIDEAVKVLGEATAIAKLHREVKAEIKLNVVAAE